MPHFGKRHLRQKKGFHTSVRTAEQAGQTLNIDLCFVPAVHACADKLPAVSGSSGRLVVERQSQPKAERVFPGQLFADPQLSYHEMMQQFAQASHKRFEQRKYPLPPPRAGTDFRLALRAEAAALRDRRRVVRIRRQAEDQAWRELWKKRQAVLEARRANGGAIAWTDDAEDVEWSVLRQRRHTALCERQAQDAEWRSKHQKIRQALVSEVLPASWRAILLITDNCTRQCYELPLFASGGRVSAEEVVKAFERVVPNGVAFVISDQGTHFMAKLFGQLATRAGFVHVPIARHRPQSNGIAERCVRTLKEWLQDKTWSSDEELSVLLEAFRLHYNDRPHQGLGISGLSPNEFAHRIWLF